MLILYALLVFALSSSILADSDESDSDAAEKAARPKALEYSKNSHLIHHTWIRFKSVEEAKKRASWPEDQDLDDVLKFIPDGNNGIVNVTYLTVRRQLKGTTLGKSSYGKAADINKKV